VLEACEGTEGAVLEACEGTEEAVLEECEGTEGAVGETPDATYQPAEAAERAPEDYLVAGMRVSDTAGVAAAGVSRRATTLLPATPEAGGGSPARCDSVAPLGGARACMNDGRQ
jgi:hypothetical protein